MIKKHFPHSVLLFCVWWDQNHSAYTNYFPSCELSLSHCHWLCLATKFPKGWENFSCLFSLSQRKEIKKRMKLWNWNFGKSALSSSLSSTLFSKSSQRIYMNSQNFSFKFSATEKTLVNKILPFACISESSQQKHLFTFIWEINMCSHSKWINLMMSCHFHCTIFNSPDDDKSLDITSSHWKLACSSELECTQYSNTFHNTISFHCSTWAWGGPSIFLLSLFCVSALVSLC